MKDEELQTLNNALRAAAEAGWFDERLRRDTSYEEDAAELFGWTEWPAGLETYLFWVDRKAPIIRRRV